VNEEKFWIEKEGRERALYTFSGHKNPRPPCSRVPPGCQSWVSFQAQVEFELLLDMPHFISGLSTLLSVLGPAPRSGGLRTGSSQQSIAISAGTYRMCLAASLGLCFWPGGLRTASVFSVDGSLVVLCEFTKTWVLLLGQTASRLGVL